MLLEVEYLLFELSFILLGSNEWFVIGLIDRLSVKCRLVVVEYLSLPHLIDVSQQLFHPVLVDILHIDKPAVLRQQLLNLSFELLIVPIKLQHGLGMLLL